MKPVEPIKCPWCTREVTPTHKRRLPNHLNHGLRKCCGSGQPVGQVVEILRRRGDYASEDR